MRNYWTLPLQQKFLTHFSQLLQNGFATSQALAVMKVLFKDSEVQKIETACSHGQPFAKTLKDLQFETRCVYLISCSEEAGSLLTGIQKASQFSEFNLENKNELMKKIRYPLQLFIAMIGILIAVFVIFVPQIQNFYESFGMEGDQVYLSSTLYIIGSFLGLIGLLSVFIFTVLRWEHAKFQRIVKFIFFKTPLLNEIVKKMVSYYFSSQWLLFISCGLSLKDSLNMMQNFETIPLLKLILHEISDNLELGSPLDQLFSDSDYFTPYFKLVIAHALQIGTLEIELSNYSKFEFTYLSQLLNSTFKGIQLIFLLLIGILIILIYLSILQPVFDMVQLI
ncbi:MAG: type II secretion system F family protein [Turicibacter sp.]